MTEKQTQTQTIIEGLLFAADQPMTVAQLVELMAEHEPAPTRESIKADLKALQEACEGRGVELVEVASGFQYRVRQEVAPFLNKLWQERPPRYSRASLETLALIAYKQPITRAEIEEVRGVAVSSHIIRAFLEREWIRVLGHKEVPGKPALYGTTKQFLDYFNLKSLKDLPELPEPSNLDEAGEQLEMALNENEESITKDTADDQASEIESNDTEASEGDDIENLEDKHVETEELDTVEDEHTESEAFEPIEDEHDEAEDFETASEEGALVEDEQSTVTAE
ncbi:MAG: SMC-Scp complex subunit ScpB [Gammaproteobacteria bacterium]